MEYIPGNYRHISLKELFEAALLERKVFLLWMITTVNNPKIYADMTFLINFIMDFVILWATAKISGVNIVYRRLLLASFVGGIYGIGYLYEKFNALYTLPLKLLFSVLLILLAFWPAGWNELKKSFLYFYGISFAAAGATIAGSYLLNNYAHRTTFSYLWLLGGVFFAFIIGIYGEKYLTNSIIPSLLKYAVELRFGDVVCSGQGFIDTGNGLRDPLTRRPVVIAEYALIKDCLPDDFRFAMEESADENSRLEALSKCSWANRLRLIPFTSIGKKNGLLIGVRCDEILVDPAKRKLFHKNLVVGIYPDRLSCEGKYELLIPSEIMQ